jgi:inhibitor of KinA sporulation pathway (predicted exonuclease)
MVEDAQEFPIVIDKFAKELISKVKNPKTIRFCAWGTYFDIPIFRKLCQQYKIPFTLSGTAFDIKTLAMMWMSLSNHRTDKLSVSHVAEVMGIKPIGKYHNAYYDAEMESSILRRVFSDFNSGTFVNGHRINIEMW